MVSDRAEGIAFERVGSGEPQLLLHGTGGSRAHWKPIVEHLADERDLLLVDLPGHGQSDPVPDGVPHNPLGYAPILTRFVDSLGIDTAHVAGNSVGGWTALELAKLARTKSVVGLAPAGLWEHKDPWRCVAQLWIQHKTGRLFAPLAPAALRNDIGRKLLLKGTVAKPEQVPSDEAIDLVTTYSATTDFDRHLSDTRNARFEGGSSIESPVVVAWGEDERLIPERARRKHELPKQARVVTLPDCGHTPMWDDPQLVARTILDAANDRTHSGR